MSDQSLSWNSPLLFPSQKLVQPILREGCLDLVRFNRESVAAAQGTPASLFVICLCVVGGSVPSGTGAACCKGGSKGEGAPCTFIGKRAKAGPPPNASSLSGAEGLG